MNMVCDSRQDTEKFLWLMTGRDGFELPGETCIHTWFLNPGDKKKQSCFYFPSELDKAVDDAQRMSGNVHVYVGLGYRKMKLLPDERGEKKDIAGIPCLWVEVDVKGGTHKEPKLPETKAEAIELVKNLLPAMPPNCVVDSGGGIYAFWFFDKPWIFENDAEREAGHNLNKNLSNALKLKASEKDWKTDTVSDLPRVLRLAGTKNIKNLDDIRDARIVECSDRFYTVDELKQMLPNVLSEPKKKAPLARKLRVIPNNVSVQKQEEYPPTYFDLVKSKCRFISHCVEDAADLTEPQWYAMLTIAARCENGEALCHVISKPYPGYSEEETALKIEQALMKTGPVTCVHIETNLTDEYCKTCPYKDKVTSPINLGTRTDFIDELNQEYAVVLVGGKCCVLRETNDPINGHPDITLMSFPDFHNWLADKKIQILEKPRSISKIWEKSDRRRKYEGIIFNPKEDIKGYYNLWRGFAIEPKEGDCSLYLDHIFNVIAGGDENIYQWILGWMARIIKDPGGTRPGTAIVMLGKQGTGKGVFVKYFGNIIGNHYIQINNQNQVTGHFNSHLKAAILVYCDEAIWGGNKDAEGVLKGMVTEDMIMVEAKGKDSYPVTNHMNLIFASNNDWVIPAGLEERRFCVLDVKDSVRGDGEYFTNICDQMENGGCEALHYFLQKFDISKIDLRNIPKTNALFEQKMHSMNSFKKWWYDALQNEGFYNEDEEKKVEFWPWNQPHETKRLYDAYLLSSKEVNGKNHLSQAQFGTDLNKISPKIVKTRPSINGQRIGCYVLPPLEECRKYFEILVSAENNISWTTENYFDENEMESTKCDAYPSITLRNDVFDDITL